MNVAAILFGVAALGGIIMAMIRLSGRDYPPAFLAVVHGLFAAAGLVALLLAVFAPGVATSFKIALVLFVGAALGGFWLVSYHFKRQALPIPLMLVHALVAVVAFVILLAGIFGHT